MRLATFYFCALWSEKRERKIENIENRAWCIMFKPLIWERISKNVLNKSFYSQNLQSIIFRVSKNISRHPVFQLKRSPALGSLNSSWLYCRLSESRRSLRMPKLGWWSRPPPPLPPPRRRRRLLLGNRHHHHLGLLGNHRHCHCDCSHGCSPRGGRPLYSRILLDGGRDRPGNLRHRIPCLFGNHFEILLDLHGRHHVPLGDLLACHQQYQPGESCPPISLR